LRNQILTGDWGKVNSLFKDLPKLMEQNLALATKRNAISTRDHIKRTIARGRPEWPSNSPLTKKYKGSDRPLVDSGDYMNSVSSMKISPHVFFVGIPMRGRGGGKRRVSIAMTHEFGATIRPKKAKVLTIPVSREASRLAREHKGIRNIPGLFSPKGKMILARSSGGKLEALFIMKTKVVIPARPAIGPGFEDQKGHIKNRIRDAVRSTVRGKRYVA